MVDNGFRTPFRFVSFRSRGNVVVVVVDVVVIVVVVVVGLDWIG